MDTLTILKTMRAVVADEPAERLDMTMWFDRGRNCGCVIGLTLRAQPKLGKVIDMRLNHGFLALKKSAQLMISGQEVGSGHDWDYEVARVTGLTPDEAAHLFEVGQRRSEAFIGGDTG